MEKPVLPQAAGVCFVIKEAGVTLESSRRLNII
jgi:hypothetical protein